MFHKLMGSLALVSTLLVFTGCGDDPVAPPTGGGGGTPTPDCERNHTAAVRFKNTSDRSTYTVILNGNRIGTIGPDESILKTLAAGQHSVRWMYSNTSQNACTPSSPIFSQCSSQILSCSADR